ncbi:alpha/beta hydrolase [[Clostridium] fimetarium]|uniref:Acetyl esterase/lipase n=1 Tax=[Clostridium] fimetarium TaxID=99656 RepID=A0A1I0R0B5_9FIRM|nr:alpha/beta hydrolase [[Clostridium] fimetarium]SEW33771.1 Acetyl esterase/lipase [[Clostridium] fimetarium]
MAINKAMKLAMKALSYSNQDLEHYRKLMNIKTIDPFKKFYDTSDKKIYNGDYLVPVRIYRTKKHKRVEDIPVILFLHGGGWVSESVETYNRICKNLADKTNHVVVSVDYRLAPEYKFPTALEDCYAVAKAIFLNNDLNIKPENITLVGDSAGGNLAAALSLLARDRGEFMPKRQILIYPCVNSDFSDETPYRSVIENGMDYLLTRKNMIDYVDMYKSCDEDLQSPYFSPILTKDFSNQPKTLIITAEFDPLRDEGEAYGKKLSEAGNEVEIHRISDALHGFFALSTRYFHVKQLYKYMNEFLK